MDSANITELFQQADNELNKARGELYQPAEDVVNYTVCVFARRALYRFLACLYIQYVNENDDTPEENPTLKQLINYCSKYDKQLEALDFSSVYCQGTGLNHNKEEEFFYCNDVFKVKYCTELAENVRELVVKRS